MKPLSNPANGCMRIGLVMTAFFLASQPARASAFLFAMPPQIGFADPGASETPEVRLPNAGPDPAMTIAEFPFDFTIFDDAPASTPETYGLSGSLRFQRDIATGFTPNVAGGFAGPARRAAGATMASGCAVYSISPEATLGGILRIGVGSPGAGTSLWDAGDNISSSAEEMRNGAVTQVSGPQDSPTYRPHSARHGALPPASKPDCKEAAQGTGNAEVGAALGAHVRPNQCRRALLCGVKRPDGIVGRTLSSVNPACDTAESSRSIIRISARRLSCLGARFPR